MRAFTGISISFFPLYGEISKDMEMLFAKNGKIVKAENLHVTLQFHGEISMNRAEELWKNMKFPEYRFQITGDSISHFPEETKRARIIFIHILSKELSELAYVNHWEQSFHCTLCRLNKPENINELEMKYKGTVFFNLTVERICMFSSELTSSGPIYREIFCHQLI